jgi:hypothetical protein
VQPELVLLMQSAAPSMKAHEKTSSIFLSQYASDQHAIVHVIHAITSARTTVRIVLQKLRKERIYIGIRQLLLNKNSYL